MDNMTTLQLGLKTDFRQHLQNTVSLKSFLIKRIEAAGKSYMVGGRGGEAVWSIEQEYGYGLGAHAEGGALNEAYADLFENYVVPLPRFNIAMEFSTDALAYTRKASTKFFTENILRRKIKVVRNIAQHFLATGVWMAGDGLYATCSAQTYGTAILLDNTGNAIWLRPGMRIVFEDQALPGTLVNATGTRIVGIRRKGTQSGSPLTSDQLLLETDPGLDNAKDYNIYIQNRFLATEMNGVGNLISDVGTVGGVNRADPGKEFAQAWMLPVAGDLTEAQMQKLNDYIRDYSPNVEHAAEFTGSSQDVRNLFEVLRDRHRFMDNREMSAGFQSLMIYTGDGAKPLHSDPYARVGGIFAFTPSQWLMLWPEGEKGGTWLDEDGNILKLKVGSNGREAAYQGFWEMRPQMFCDDYQCQGYIYGYTYQSGVA